MVFGEDEGEDGEDKEILVAQAVKAEDLFEDVNVDNGYHQAGQKGDVKPAKGKEGDEFLGGQEGQGQSQCEVDQLVG